MLVVYSSLCTLCTLLLLLSFQSVVAQEHQIHSHKIQLFNRMPYASICHELEEDDLDNSCMATWNIQHLNDYKTFGPGLCPTNFTWIDVETKICDGDGMLRTKWINKWKRKPKIPSVIGGLSLNDPSVTGGAPDFALSISQDVPNSAFKVYTAAGALTFKGAIPSITTSVFKTLLPKAYQLCPNCNLQFTIAASKANPPYATFANNGATFQANKINLFLTAGNGSNANAWKLLMQLSLNTTLGVTFKNTTGIASGEFLKPLLSVATVNAAVVKSEVGVLLPTVITWLLTNAVNKALRMAIVAFNAFYPGLPIPVVAGWLIKDFALQSQQGYIDLSFSIQLPDSCTGVVCPGLSYCSPSSGNSRCIDVPTGGCTSVDTCPDDAMCKEDKGGHTCTYCRSEPCIHKNGCGPPNPCTDGVRSVCQMLPSGYGYEQHICSKPRRSQDSAPHRMRGLAAANPPGFKGPGIITKVSTNAMNKLIRNLTPDIVDAIRALKCIATPQRLQNHISHKIQPICIDNFNIEDIAVKQGHSSKGQNGYFISFDDIQFNVPKTGYDVWTSKNVPGTIHCKGTFSGKISASPKFFVNITADSNGNPKIVTETTWKWGVLSVNLNPTGLCKVVKDLLEYFIGNINTLLENAIKAVVPPVVNALLESGSNTMFRQLSLKHQIDKFAGVNYYLTQNPVTVPGNNGTGTINMYISGQFVKQTGTAVVATSVDQKRIEKIDVDFVPPCKYNAYASIPTGGFNGNRPGSGIRMGIGGIVDRYLGGGTPREGVINKYGPLRCWDVSKVVNMKNLFYGLTDFGNVYSRDNLTNWFTGQVRDMSYMFKGAQDFNSNIAHWNVFNVKDMTSMFNGCTHFTRMLCDKTWIDSTAKGKAGMFAGSLGHMGNVTCAK